MFTTKFNDNECESIPSTNTINTTSTNQNVSSVIESLNDYTQSQLDNDFLFTANDIQSISDDRKKHDDALPQMNKSSEQIKETVDQLLIDFSLFVVVYFHSLENWIFIAFVSFIFNDKLFCLNGTVHIHNANQLWVQTSTSYNDELSKMMGKYHLKSEAIETNCGNDTNELCDSVLEQNVWFVSSIEVCVVQYIVYNS